MDSSYCHVLFTTITSCISWVTTTASSHFRKPGKTPPSRILSICPASSWTNIGSDQSAPEVGSVLTGMMRKTKNRRFFLGGLAWYNQMIISTMYCKIYIYIYMFFCFWCPVSCSHQPILRNSGISQMLDQFWRLFAENSYYNYYMYRQVKANWSCWACGNSTTSCGRFNSVRNSLKDWMAYHALSMLI